MVEDHADARGGNAFDRQRLRLGALRHAGLQVEGTFRAHQVPLSDPATHPEHLKHLEDWLKSYRLISRLKVANSRGPSLKLGSRRPIHALSPNTNRVRPGYGYSRGREGGRSSMS